MLLASLAINVVLFLAYKYCYPLPDFCSDAEGYIHVAVQDIKIYYRPFGYPRFLQLVHTFATSHFWLTAIQYFLAVSASLSCFLTVDYLYGFRRRQIRLLSWVLLSVNPALLVMSNIMLSDVLFVSLSLFWFCSCLFILKRKKWWALFAQLLLLYCCFAVRYNALYYPVVAVSVFVMMRRVMLPYRLVGIAASLFVIYASAHAIVRQTQKATGTPVFSGFSGWQLANNALYIYKDIDRSTLQFDEPEMVLLDSFVRTYMDSIPLAAQQTIAARKPGSVFLWEKKSPLKQFVFYETRLVRGNYYHTWYHVATLYQAYGAQIIRQNPGSYISHYMLPNLWLYFVPDPEMLDHYMTDTGKVKGKVTAETIKWLDIKEQNVTTHVAGLQQTIMAGYPAAHGLYLVFCCIIPIVYLVKSRRREGGFRKEALAPVLLWMLFLSADILFNTASSNVTLRYVMPLFIAGFSLPLYFLDQALPERNGGKVAV